MSQPTPYHENFFLRVFFPVFILSLLLILDGCKKDDAVEPVQPPLEMKVVSGNNQVGEPYTFLTDPIVIKIKPQKESDLQTYSIEFRNNPLFTAGQKIMPTIVDGEYVYAFGWKLGAPIKESEELTVLLFANCKEPYGYGCTPLDSVVVTARFR